jgi:hypothetical protein
VRGKAISSLFQQRAGAMTSKTIVLKILDMLVMAFLCVLAFSVVGLPMGWMPRLFHMSPREFRDFSIFVVFAAMLLMHAIATSDSAP